ncbi:PREDICTED: rho GTPase-activating protein 5-like [Nicotiana attenuata]|uniref:Rho gtpase-activating protein 1 n=1 Tax=Nicotiana attenuata TaxID=49451 RepID=A0A1J6IAA2_NICAT|nr:PREDICTED: rho GTPase-activating protein 5-like [Nicotiana attenuata]OIT01498.1 rho gtpase-activating protein 1 [Nicotiana attenuata]
MTEIIQTPSQFPSCSSSITSIPCLDNDGSYQESVISGPNVDVYNTEVQEGGIFGRKIRERKRREREEGDQLSLLTLLVTGFRKSLVACSSNFDILSVEEQQLSSSFSSSMEISWPSNVRHVAHVTFDRFNGFLGLPVEFEPDVPRRPPSASTRVFGVSTDCMQLSFDSRGNSVPTILLMMQGRLYAQGGLQAEGIFRINAENGQEEFVREQLNRGIIPDNIDVHCLAGLIKAWFRELPRGVLDSLSPEEIMRAQSEDECVRLVRLLPPTEAALLDWAINLMADVAQLESFNKMNARNIAMVFAPNMTQMADPLTALMYAVQVMNFLKTLILRTLKDREESVMETGPAPELEPFDENGHHSSFQPIGQKSNEVEEEEDIVLSKGRPSTGTANSTLGEIKVENESHALGDCLSEISNLPNSTKDEVGVGNVNLASGRIQPKIRRTKSVRSSSSSLRGSKKGNEWPIVHVAGNVEKGKGVRIIDRLNSTTERVEAWR